MPRTKKGGARMFHRGEEIEGLLRLDKVKGKMVKEQQDALTKESDKIQKDKQTHTKK